HLAGATAGVATLAALQSHPALGPEPKRLHDDIQEDKRALEDIIRRLGIVESAVRQAAGWVAERVAEAKILVDDPSSGALRELELLESIAIGVHGKRCLWTTLQSLADDGLPLQTIDFARLVERADDQRVRIEALRMNAARRALAA
ncbi:MAG TPA: hypothetical protein VHZ73_09610, partial [Vicinamibacterales bacterium]|nr:hypothetical protein [Vicinamibacterales bacterium]